MLNIVYFKNYGTLGLKNPACALGEALAKAPDLDTYRQKNQLSLTPIEVTLQAVDPYAKDLAQKILTRLNQDRDAIIHVLGLGAGSVIQREPRWERFTTNRSGSQTDTIINNSTRELNYAIGGALENNTLTDLGFNIGNETSTGDYLCNRLMFLLANHLKEGGLKPDQIEKILAFVHLPKFSDEASRFLYGNYTDPKEGVRTNLLITYHGDKGQEFKANKPEDFPVVDCTQAVQKLVLELLKS